MEGVRAGTNPGTKLSGSQGNSEQLGPHQSKQEQLTATP
jgi:hypothetical protein